MKTAVEKSKKRYQEIFNNIQDVYYEASLNGTIIEVSPSIEKMCKYSRDSLIGVNMEKIYADPEQRNSIVRALMEKGRINDHEVLFVDKDGSSIYCSLHSMLVRTKAGNPYRIIGSLRDITDRKSAEQELLQYKNQLEALIEERTLELQRSNDGLVAQIEQRRKRG